jgi:hypothetical protein
MPASRLRPERIERFAGGPEAACSSRRSRRLNHRPNFQTAVCPDSARRWQKWESARAPAFVLARISSQLMSTPRTHLVSGHDFNRAVMAPITWGFSPCHESGYPLVSPLFRRGVNRRSTTDHHVTPVTSTSVPVCDSQLSRIQSIRSALSWGVDGGPFHGSIHFTRIPLAGFGAKRDFFCVSVQY